MTKIITTISGYDAAARTVDVKFASGEIVHRRSVNAVLTADGEYDAEATAARVEEVGLGVAVKIELGVISTPAAPTSEEA